MSTQLPMRLDVWRCTSADAAATPASGYFTHPLPIGYAAKILRVIKEAVDAGTSTVHGVAITDSRVATDPFVTPGQDGILYLSSDPSTSPPTADTKATVNRIIDEVPAQPVAIVCENAGSSRNILIWHGMDGTGDCEIRVFVELWPSHIWSITT